MKKITLFALATLVPLNAYAASVEDPVNRIIGIAKARWENTDNGGDYFEKINRDFSKSFVKVYKEAEKYPAYDEGSDPFDYDVITSSQDGCPLKDIKVASEGEKDGTAIVDASFRLMDCAEDAASKAKVSELKFDVVTENGKPLINDVHRKTDDGKWDSLVGEMKDNIKRGQQQK